MKLKTTPLTKLGFTEDEQINISSAIYNTWQAIGNDCEQANNGKSLSMASTIEAVLDADYLETYGGRQLTELTKRFRTFSYDEQKKVARFVLFHK